MLIKYIGKDEYIDYLKRFVAFENDIIDINEQEGKYLISTGLFEEVKKEKKERGAK